MTELRKLADGQFYVLTGGKEFLDHHGNVYTLAPTTPPVSVPHVSTPVAEVTDWRSGLPSVALNPASVKVVKRLKETLATLPVENFLSIGIGADGSITFEDWQPGDEVHVNVDVDRIVTKARESRSVGCAAYHNHCTGETHMSEPDKQLTALLERKLAAAKIAFLEHGVVAGDPTRVEEATRPIITTYDMRESEYRRLWHPYLSEAERQTEALPDKYPRDSFDVGTMTDQLEEAAREILRSVPLDVAKRIVQTVAQRLGVSA